MKAPTVPAEITLQGIGPVPLAWDKGAMFRADDCGLYETKGIGFARACKYVWCMAPDSVRRAYPAPEALAKVMPPLAEVWVAVNGVIAAAGEEMSPKNVFGSASGRGRSSS